MKFPGFSFNTVKPHKMDAMPAKSEYKPRIYLNLKDIPQAKGCKMGDKVKVVMELKLVGMSEHENGNGNVDFEIHKIGMEK